MSIKKNRNQKQLEYDKQFDGIPLDFKERLEYMYEIYGFDNSPKAIDEMIAKRNMMLSNLYYFDLNIVSLYEIPEGSSRPRFRLINRKNFHIEAINASSFVHVYTPNAKDDNIYMRRLVNNELITLEHKINTPVIIDYYAYLKTPTEFNRIDKCLAESGIIRPNAKKPDWDNIGKKYSDMYNYNIWLDDATVNDGSVHKYYSILPRIEIRLRYLNALYTKSQYNNIINRKEYDGSPLAYLDSKGELVNGLI